MDGGKSILTRIGYVYWGLTRPGRATAVDRLEHLWNRYNSAAVALLKGAEKAAALERVKQHVAQMKGGGGVAAFRAWRLTPPQPRRSPSRQRNRLCVIRWP